MRKGSRTGVFPNLATLTAARADLVAILLTGIPSGIVGGFQNFTGSTPADMLRLYMAMPASGAPNILGLVGGDPAGYPTWRRVFDDVVTIELRAARSNASARQSQLHAAWRGRRHLRRREPLDKHASGFIPGQLSVSQPPGERIRRTGLVDQGLALGSTRAQRQSSSVTFPLTIVTSVGVLRLSCHRR
jgi:hypothetical protein